MTRIAEQRRRDAVQDRITRHEQALVEGLRAVNLLAEAVENRLEELTAEVSELRTKLAISEDRLSDVQGHWTDVV